MTEFFNRLEQKQKRRDLRNCMPKAEVILWARLKNRQLMNARFRRQYSIGQFVVDFYCPELHLAVEVDGDSHFVEETREYDAERHKLVDSFGVKMLRFLNTDVYENMDGVLEAIAREIEVRRSVTTTPPAPPSKGGEKR